MIAKNVTYIDFDGVERTETFYFNLTAAEIAAWELSTEGGMRKKIEEITAAKDLKQLSILFMDILDRSYGRKSPGGRRFEKSEAILTDFKSTQAYSDIYMALATDAEKATEFLNALVPKDRTAAPAAQTAAPAANAPILMPAT